MSSPVSAPVAHLQPAISKKKDIILKVYIIRHGEKPDAGENLSGRGLDRALQLPSVLSALIGIPDYTYVPTINTGKQTSDMRMMQTITPFAVQNNLVLNSKYKKEDAKAVAKSVMKKKGTVLLVWEHENIPRVTKALGAKKVPTWDGADFDSMWIIAYTKQDLEKGKASSFTTSTQENITSDSDCPAK